MGKTQSKTRLEEVIRSLPKESSDIRSLIVDESKTIIANGKKSITIVMVGETGVGRSRLVNALIGSNKAQEGNKFVPGTAKTPWFTTSKYGLNINILKTPGEEEDSEDEEFYWKKIVENSKDIDVLLYCVRMDDLRLRPQDEKATEKIIDKLGVEIWKKAMIVLTFANRVEPNSSYKGTHRKYFIERLECFTVSYLECFKKFKVEYDVDCVPVGDVGEQSLPICKDWRQVFWMMAFKIINEEIKRTKSFNTGEIQSKNLLEQVLRWLPNDISDTCSYIVEEFKTFLENGKDSMTIALVGKTGVGKSRLVNALIGEFEAYEGNKLVPGTKKADLYTTTKHGVEINVWDTPGVEDGSEHEESYLQKLFENIKNIDLLLYCVKMDDTRVRTDDTRAIKKIIKKLGVEIWKNALIVFTFANKVEPNSDYEGPPKEFFEEKLQLFKEEYRKCLKKNGVECDVECVPAGDIRKQALPICEDWLPVFWLMAFKVANEKVRPALLQANHERLKFPSLPGEDYDTTKTGEAPITLSENEEMQLWEMVIPVGRHAAKKGAKIGAFAFGIGAVFGAAGGLVYGVIQGLRKFYALKNAQAEWAEKSNSIEEGTDTTTESKPKPKTKPKPKLPKPTDQSSNTANPDSQSTPLSTFSLSNKKQGPPVKPKPKKSPNPSARQMVIEKEFKS